MDTREQYMSSVVLEDHIHYIIFIKFGTSRGPKVGYVFC